MRGEAPAIAAEALGFMAYNFTRQNAALGELMDAALAAEPCEAPRPARLGLPPERTGKASGAARELPNGRGWLRVVHGKGGATPPAANRFAAPAPSPSTPNPDATSSVAGADQRQLDLFAWVRPTLPQGMQLSLFDEPEE